MENKENIRDFIFGFLYNRKSNIDYFLENRKFINSEDVSMILFNVSAVVYLHYGNIKLEDSIYFIILEWLKKNDYKFVLTFDVREFEYNGIKYKLHE